MSQLVPQTDKMNTVAGLITSKAMLAQMAAALPKHMTPERMARLVLTELRRNPALLDCSRQSLLGSIIQASQLGLEPGVLGQCWIIPFGKEATFIPGYRGYAQLAWRSSLVKALAARAVFGPPPVKPGEEPKPGDHFFFDFGEDRLEHRPAGNSDPALLTHVYATMHTTSGGRLFDVMTREEVDRIRTRSRAGQSGPWKTDYVEMAKKTVFRRLMKLAPASVEMVRAMTLDDAADTGMPQDFDLPPLDPELAVDAPATEEREPGEEG